MKSFAKTQAHARRSKTDRVLCFSPSAKSERSDGDPPRHGRQSTDAIVHSGDAVQSETRPVTCEAVAVPLLQPNHSVHTLFCMSSASDGLFE